METEICKQLSESTSKMEVEIKGKEEVSSWVSGIGLVKKGGVTLEVGEDKDYTVTTAEDQPAKITFKDRGMSNLGNIEITPDSLTQMKKIYFDEDHTTETIGLGEFIDLKDYLHVEGTTEEPTWETSDSTLVSIDNDGQIIAQGVTGTDPVTITAKIDNGRKSATCIITVDPDVQKNYLTLSNDDPTTASNITWTKATTGTQELKYKNDLSESSWSSFPDDSTGIQVEAGKKIYLKGNLNSFGSNTGEYNTIKITNGSVTLNGSLMNLMLENFDAENERPKTTASSYCFYKLFQSSYGLAKIVEDEEKLLPTTSLGLYCYAHMFWNCKYLTTIPEKLLPATELADHCYDQMFYSNDALSSISKDLLPADKLAESCYLKMFSGCKSLTEIPEGLLPATELQISCYQGMFASCTFTKLPLNLLPAGKDGVGNLARSCYYGMFEKCALLQNTPLLSATTLVDNCYERMFVTCSKLNVSQGEPGVEVVEKGIIFTCPSLESLTDPVSDMFLDTCLSPSDPTAGNTYYWYTTE